MGGADLGRTNLSAANLYRTDLSGTFLYEAVFNEAVFGDTILGDTNLAEARGLEECRHIRRSVIDLQTIVRSRGDIPEAFLRGAGVPDDLVYTCALSCASHRVLLLLHRIFSQRRRVCEALVRRPAI